MILLDENIVFNTVRYSNAELKFCFTNQAAGIYLLALMIVFYSLLLFVCRVREFDTC